MGAAAWQRGNDLIARQVDEGLPDDLELLRRELNTLPPPDAPAPLADTIVVFQGGAWWFLDAERGFAGYGYRYENLRQVFSNWAIYSYGYGRRGKGGLEGFLCVPRPPQRSRA